MLIYQLHVNKFYTLKCLNIIYIYILNTDNRIFPSFRTERILKKSRKVSQMKLSFSHLFFILVKNNTFRTRKEDLFSREGN